MQIKSASIPLFSGIKLIPQNGPSGLSGDYLTVPAKKSGGIRLGVTGPDVDEYRKVRQEHKYHPENCSLTDLIEYEDKLRAEATYN